MPAWTLPAHPDLSATSRLTNRLRASDAASAAEWVLLAFFGASAAAASSWLDFGLKVPGHAILRAVFPMACGLALVPRRGAGAVMACSAAATVLLFHNLSWTGHGSGPGATASLLATGPLLDVALWRARAGWRMWLGFAAAGCAANLVALVVRGSAKAAGVGAGSHRLSGWLQTAPLTYLACGLAAGLLSGAVWFAYRPRPVQPGGPS